MNIQSDDMTPSPDYDESPCIYLTDEQCKALGITQPPRAGTQLMVMARAMVESVTESKDGDDDDPDVCLRLRLTHMELGAAPQSSADSLYGEKD